MRPFSISEGAVQLLGSYPESAVVRGALGSLKREEKLGFLRLWVSEGIPFAFRESPMLYEALRGWLAAQLLIHPKVITAIGSARTGYSLCPNPKYGSPFGVQSDLDLSIIDQGLFSQLSTDFKRWVIDLNSGSSIPSTAAEEKHWPENNRTVPGNISKGFIDPYKIPAQPRYAAAQRVLDIQSLLVRKINATSSAPKFRRVSARVYRDWKAFLDQMELNLHYTVRSFALDTVKK